MYRVAGKKIRADMQSYSEKETSVTLEEKVFLPVIGFLGTFYVGQAILFVSSQFENIFRWFKWTILYVECWVKESIT